MTKKKKTQNKHASYSLLDEISASTTEPIKKEWRTYQLTMMYNGLNRLEKSESPTKDDWRACADAVNLMETLIIDMKVCDDNNGLLIDAIAALAKAGKRSKENKTLRLDGHGIQAVRSVLRDYAELLEVLPERVMIRCYRLTEKRIQEILNRKLKPHDIEICKL